VPSTVADTGVVPSPVARPPSPGGPLPSLTLAGLVGHRVLDAELAALTWLLVEGGVPVMVIGSAPAALRSAVAGAVLGVVPGRAWLVLDADLEAPTLAPLSTLLQGGAGVGITLSAHGLQEAMDRLVSAPGSLPEDAVRRLGMIVVVDETSFGVRVSVAHYLRPTERDGQGHLQRRPPAVLAAWDGSADAWEHYAWGITPELADRVDRSQADFEERQKDRAGFLAAMAQDGTLDADDWSAVVKRYLATEPTRTSAPARPAAQQWPSGGSPGDPHRH